LPREVLTAEQGYWTAARVPRVATLAGDDESGPAPGDRRRGVSLVTRALRQVIAVLFSLAILLAVSGPALAATSVFLSNDSAGSEVTYVVRSQRNPHTLKGESPMRTRPILLSLLSLALLSPSTAAVATDHHRVFAAQLLGTHEVPPINTEGSATFKLTIHDASIDFELQYANLSAPPAAAHIHFAQPRVNGGVMVFFCGGGGQPACPATTSGTVAGAITGALVIGPSAQGIDVGDFDAVLQAIRTGEAYANMHTLNFPAGEIRGQIVSAPRRN